MSLGLNLFFIVLFYLVGSIPFALLITKVFGHGDIRNIGSGNVGATNVLRTGNKFLAFFHEIKFKSIRFSARFLSRISILKKLMSKFYFLAKKI